MLCFKLLLSVHGMCDMEEQYLANFAWSALQTDRQTDRQQWRCAGA